jgi:hypothetical protein
MRARSRPLLVVMIAVGLAALAPRAALAEEAPAKPAAAKPAAAPAAKAPTIAELDARLARVEATLGELARVAADEPAVAKAVADLKAEVAALRQDVDALQNGAAGEQALIARVDELDQRVTRIGEQAASLRADVEARRAPEAGGGGGRWDDGFVLVDGDRFSLKLSGYAELRYTTRFQEAFDPVDGSRVLESGFSLPRVRLSLGGHAQSSKLTYGLEVELAGGARLLEGWIEGELPHGLVVRGGQMKVPFSSEFLTREDALAFVDRPVATEEARWDRDLGLWLGWTGARGRVSAGAGLYNGAGATLNRNDNIDPLVVARVDVTAVGQPFERGEGDLDGTRDVAVQVGVAGAFENAPAPDVYGFGPGQMLNTDVDGDGRRDNVRVVSLGANLALRWRGLGVEAEGAWRREDWGVIGAQQATPFSPEKDLFGGFAQASYFVLPGRLQLGARYSRTAVSLLLDGRTRAAPPPGNLESEITAMATYWRHAHGIRLTAMWSFIDWSAAGDVAAAVDTTGQGEQRFFVEAQVSF